MAVTKEQMGKLCPAHFSADQVRCSEEKTWPYLAAIKQDKNMMK